MPPAGSMPRQLRLAQMGEMWQKPGGRALAFRAVEELAVGEVAFADYETLGGVRVPTSAEVDWELPEGRFTYFRGGLTALAIEE